MIFTNVSYPKSKNVKKNLKDPLIRKNAIIGAGAVIMPGVEIGAQVIVGSGSVVIKDLGTYEVVIGNPAKNIIWWVNLKAIHMIFE